MFHIKSDREQTDTLWIGISRTGNNDNGFVTRVRFVKGSNQAKLVVVHNGYSNWILISADLHVADLGYLLQLFKTIVMT